MAADRLVAACMAAIERLAEVCKGLVEGGRDPAPPSDLSSTRFPVGTTVDAAERQLILQTLQATGGNKTRAAELIGISLKTLHNKLKQYERQGRGNG